MIAITGVGLVSCLGNNTAQSFYNFQKGICGVREIERFSTQYSFSQICYIPPPPDAVLCLGRDLLSDDVKK